MDLEKTLKRGVSRRKFLRGAAVTAAGVAGSRYVGGPYILRASAADEQKVNVLFVGTGGQANTHVQNLLKNRKQNCIAYTDVDSKRQGDIKGLAPDAPSYTDWRKMYEKHLDKADMVVIAVPDHSHAVASSHALKAGKAVYTEKPLTWSIDEARVLAKLAGDKQVPTQMGNMGHANDGNRLIVEWVRAGVIGDVKEVHTWTNRPIWPQGIMDRPPAINPPANLDWESWIGPGPFREFHDSLHPFAWRGWQDYGCGAIGDMGCHTFDSVFWSMQPDYPSSVTLLEIEGPGGKETFPSKSHFVWEFPAKGGRPAWTAHWYSGGFKPPVPDEIKNDPTRTKKELSGSGNLYIGTKGKIYVQGDYGEPARLIPESFMKEAKLPAQYATIPKSPGHMDELLMAVRKEKPWNFPGSHFSTYAGPLTEVLLVGSISEKMGQVGYKIECDAPGRKIVNPEALSYVTRQNRPGWEL